MIMSMYTGHKEPAAQATVQLLSLPDSAYAAGIASSNKGWFTLPKVKAGKYLLKISYIGFRTKFVPVQLSNNVPEKKWEINSRRHYTNKKFIQ